MDRNSLLAYLNHGIHSKLPADFIIDYFNQGDYDKSKIYELMALINIATLIGILPLIHKELVNMAIQENEIYCLLDKNNNVIKFY